MDAETHEAVKFQARREGMIFTAWILRLIRRTLGLSDEVPQVPENQTSTPATPLSDVDVLKENSGGAGSGVSEMNLETRLRASVKQADSKRRTPKVQL